MRYDTIVIGGGSAGATAALKLAKAGARVLLLDLSDLRGSDLGRGHSASGPAVWRLGRSRMPQ